VQVGEAIVVAAREVAVGIAGMGAESRDVAHRLAELAGAGEVVALEERAGGGHERDGGAGGEAWREDRLGMHRCSGYDWASNHGSRRMPTSHSTQLATAKAIGAAREAMLVEWAAWLGR